MTPCVEAFLDADSETYSYVVYDRAGGRAAVIDPVLDFDSASGRTATAGVQRLIRFVREQGLTLEWILETHAHADHLSAAPVLRAELGGRIAIGAGIVGVQRVFSEVFNLAGDAIAPDGEDFDHLFQDGERFPIGTLEVCVLHTPGHTPADVSYLIGDAVFVGDTLFMPDVGTARCDFPGGDAVTLYRSIHRLLELPDETRVFVCHDYPGDRRAYRCETTVAEQRRLNKHVRDGVDEATFVAWRRERDASLSMPRLILPSIQVNIRAGKLPLAESNGTRYLKLPLDRL
jgi:glyoxylase-like metal-dependent hydrolase (beta-lactamase superfamily II)